MKQSDGKQSDGKQSDAKPTVAKLTDATQLEAKQLAALPANGSSGFAYWAAATVLLSAFLLFQVQPLISRTILPWFGGSPAVWTTSMLFFQVLLLGGYAYAHGLSRLRRPSAQWAVHLALLVAAVALLPIMPDPSWKPADSLRPVDRILLLLTAHVGLPYFLLSTTGPLVQAWYAQVQPGSPYRLYALSNAGSLAALISYPIVFEPMFDTRIQAILWSAAFGVFAMLCGALAWQYARRASAEPPQGYWPVKPVSMRRRLAWLLLPALASVMLLAATSRICQDIAVSPFMWVVPLSLYLLTFIICFDRESWYQRTFFAVAAMVSVLVVCNVMLADEMETAYAEVGLRVPIGWLDNDIKVEVGVALSMLFFVCMVCHGELVRLKPPPSQLTQFYLMVAAGVPLGGVTVGVLCPWLFNFYLEWNLGLIACLALGVCVYFAATWEFWRQATYLIRGVAGLLVFCGLVVAAWAQLAEYFDGATARQRSFYGVLSVRDYGQGRGLYNGRILHGYQYTDDERRREPTTYYDEPSGVGLALSGLRNRGRPLRVGVVGLGAGTLAAYGQPQDVFRFYEINPQVIEFAGNSPGTYFTFLSDSPARTDTVLGDARISLEQQLEQQQEQQFDLLALDAFSGDSIPTHLLTVEAFEVYLPHMAPEGVVAVHISNRHLDLAPVVAALADHFHLHAVQIDRNNSGSSLADCSSTWVLRAARSRELLEWAELAEGSASLDEVRRVLWTDAYSNLLKILH